MYISALFLAATARLDSDSGSDSVSDWKINEFRARDNLRLDLCAKVSPSLLIYAIFIFGRNLNNTSV